MSDTAAHVQAGEAPLVSIVVNNYNYGRYLRHAIDSALAQTYSNVEVIVVDDGSTDDSVDIIRSYRDRVHAIVKRNGGQGSAFNAGFGSARGSLVAFLDSDDVFLPGKVAGCVRASAEYPSAGLVYHRVQTIDACGTVGGKPFPKRLQRGSIAHRVQRGGGTWHYPPTSGMVFRREFLERILPVPEDLYRISADAYVACLAGMLTEVIGIADVLTQYRVHGANAYTYAALSSEGERLRQHIRRYEIETAALNAALERLGSRDRVTLEDNFIYQLDLVKTGLGSSVWWLLWLTARDPVEQWVRTKTIVSNLPALIRSRRAPAPPTWDTPR